MEKQNLDLGDLLAEPREALDLEIKEWLDLTDNNHRALVAKEIIALANHGGGYLVIGFEELADGSFQSACTRPPNLTAWSQDAIQSIISKYVDPSVQCSMVHQIAPASSDRYPILLVPGGHRVLIRAKSGSPDGKVVPHRVYTRRPGPTSEEPKTAEEWDRLFERVLQNRKAELLEAMRSIMAGVIPTTAQQRPSRRAELIEFEQTAISRWRAKVGPLPANASPKFPNGHYDIGLAIDGDFTAQSLAELRQTIETAVRNHSGWPPFLTINRTPFSPKAIDGAVEFWRGPESDGTYGIPSHHDFWRISPQGLFFTRMGYREDGGQESGFSGLKPGKYFHITTPTWRLGETILEGFYIARALDARDANLIIHSAWNGLTGRRLTARGTSRMLFNDYAAEQDAFEATQTVALDAILETLPEVVHAILAPLYELFGFFVLPKRLVEEELASLQRNQF